MLLSFITPTSQMQKFQSQSDFILALSHLINREEINQYEKEITALNLPIILDNGLFENHYPEGIDSLLKKANRINATCFFAPDYLYKAKETLKALNTTIYIMEKMKIKIDLGVVVQGETEEEWFWLYNQLQKIDQVKLIGLSILSIPKCFGSQENINLKKYQHNDREITSTRIKLMEKMIQKGNNNKKCHLLGLGDSYEDVKFAKNNCPWIVSNDTSSAFQNGLYGRIINTNGIIEGNKVKEKVDFNLESITTYQENLIQNNINNVKNYVNS